MAATLGEKAVKRLGHLVAVVVIAVIAAPASSDSVAGSAGTDTSLPVTDSQVTVSGRGAFSDLTITVNQTRNLVNQAVSVDWSGGAPTRNGPGRFAANYLQLMQCWGDDDGTHPENPGPPPEQCVAGAKQPVSGGGLFPQFTYAYERIISQRNWPNFDPAVGFLESETGYVWRPFRAVYGAVVGSHYNPNFRPDIEGGDSWLNPDFDVVTSNEIAAARTGPNGKGSELFEVTTGEESSGLGCGQRVEPTPDGGTRVPKCWLVVVPRGVPATENAGTPYESDADTHGVVPSPLAPAQWQNRIAIPLEFNPVDARCSIESDQTRINGSELAAPAIVSWQPKLCDAPGAKPYVYGTVSDATARQQLIRPAPGSPGMVVSLRPIDEGARDPASPVVYAPLTLSATVLAFTVERNPKLDAPADAQALAGVRVGHLNLTPRLVAKLLTQSYGQQVNIHEPAPYDWVDDNPPNMGMDPDFLRFNPEFEQLQVTYGKTFGGFVMSGIGSDAARQVWEYVFADPEAKAWLDGQPDDWGMRVNPVYATSAATNPSGVPFGEPVPASFPKSDPHCYQGPPTGPDHDVVPPVLCGTDWLPYTESMRDAARLTRAGDDRAKVAQNPFAQSPDQAWKRDLPQTIGARAILSITDSASAFQYGLQTARLSRPGESGGSRTFIAADRGGLTAGVEAMKPRSEPAVLEPDPTAGSSSAYPLTALTYAAIKPLALEETARADYAAFLEYASSPGQVAGTEPGQLPAGYAPLPAVLRIQARDAAKTVRELVAPALPAEDGPPASEAPPLPTSPASSPGAAGGSGGASAPLSSVEAALTPAVSAGSSAGPAAAVSIQQDRPRGTTPILSVGRTRFALLVLLAVALLAAVGALEITKRRRYPAAPGGGPAA